MQYLILFVLSVDKVVRLKSELRLTKLDAHGLYFDAKLLKCARMAGALGMLNWE